MRHALILLHLTAAAVAPAAEPPTHISATAGVTPNLAGNIDRPLRYTPEGEDFVIVNGTEFFNRPLYGGNTAFRVDAGDRPELTLYLPGRGGNLRLGVRRGAEAKWLHQAERIEARYRPGTMLYEIKDAVLSDGALRVHALAMPAAEGLLVQVERQGGPADLELIWAYGGVTGQRGRRDGDIGTEAVPISEYFQLKPEYCKDNTFVIDGSRFTLKSRPATIAGVMPAGSRLAVADAAAWDRPGALLAGGGGAPAQPVMTGQVALGTAPLFLALQRVADSAAAEELATYREVTASPRPTPRPTIARRPAYEAKALPQVFAKAVAHFAALRRQVTAETPDPWLNAAVGALNVAADAVWDEPSGSVQHGAVAWRSRLLGWRGPYAMDALGWHDRARRHLTYWSGRQNTDPIPATLPPPDEDTNLARSEAALHSNGDLSSSHYDMNLVYIDAVFRHLLWTGDLAFAKQVWPVIERHLAWERRLFRRQFGPEKLPLYEAYAAIWASDNLQYHGGGTTHASAYNYWHNRMAARLASALGVDGAVYEQEAEAIARGMRAHLWLEEQGTFAEFKDLLGLQRTHGSAAGWSFYHTMDGGLPTPAEAWRMSRDVERRLPHLPVRGAGVPEGLHVVSTTDWMPYTWSINNVVFAEIVHTALGHWQAGRGEEAFRLTKGALLASLYMGICPGNIGSMNYLDVYRRESQRDFGDPSGVFSRALVEGLFGLRPDALAGELRVTPGFPDDWDRAKLAHPKVTVAYRRRGAVERVTVEPRFGKPQALRLVLAARRDRVGSVTVNGARASWSPVEGSVGRPRIEIVSPAAVKHDVLVAWAGENIAPASRAEAGAHERTQGRMRWTEIGDAPTPSPVELEPLDWSRSRSAAWETIDLGAVFNDRLTRIFKNEYRRPRSPFVSLAIPKQGLGAWAGTFNAAAEIDDSGLRAAGRIVLPNGVPFAAVGSGDAPNVAFTSRWDNYPAEVSMPLGGRGRRLYLLMAGSTNHMQSRIDNGEVVVAYADGSIARLALVNPTTWWPIEQDYFIDDFAFRVPGPLPPRVDLKTGAVRLLDPVAFKGQGGPVAGGAATVLHLALDPQRPLRSLTVRTLSNEVVIGLLAATLER